MFPHLQAEIETLDTAIWKLISHCFHTYKLRLRPSAIMPVEGAFSTFPHLQAEIETI